MMISAQLIPLWLNVAAGIVMLVCVSAAGAAAPWSALRAESARQHVLLGGLLALALLWLLTFQVIDGIWIHLLGVTTLTLMVGWRFCVLAATVVLCGYVWWQQQSLQAIPVSWLFSVLIPATSTRLLVHVLRRYGFRNLFVYMLGAGFGGGLLNVLIIALLALPTFLLIGQTDWVSAALESWPMLLLLMFPEGFVNGMLATAFTVFYPDLVKTLDTDYYLEE